MSSIGRPVEVGNDDALWNCGNLAALGAGMMDSGRPRDFQRPVGARFADLRIGHDADRASTGRAVPQRPVRTSRDPVVQCPLPEPAGRRETRRLSRSPGTCSSTGSPQLSRHRNRRRAVCLVAIMPSVCFEKTGNDGSRRRRSRLQLTRGRLESLHRLVNVDSDCRMETFELQRRHVAQRGMAPAGVVPPFNELERVRLFFVDSFFAYL